MVAQKVLLKAPRMTPAEYLEWDRRQEERHEYVDGEIIAMAGVTRKHNRIAGNIYRKVEDAFDTRDCEAYIESLRVRVTSTRYRLPDVAATCMESEFADDEFDTLLNPQLIVEVQSKGTKGTEFYAKRSEYQRIESLTDYVIVLQNQRLIIHHFRDAAAVWSARLYGMPEKIIRIDSLDVSLTVADIYRKVDLPEPEPDGLTYEE